MVWLDELNVCLYLSKRMCVKRMCVKHRESPNLKCNSYNEIYSDNYKNVCMFNGSLTTDRSH